MSGDDPFQGMPFLGDLARLVQSQGPISWDAARNLAYSIATQGTPEGNVDPVARIAFEQLARVAEIQVAGATGLPTSTTGRPLQVRAATRTEWVTHTLDAWRPLFERLATSLGPADAGDAGEGGLGGRPVADHDDDDPTSAWMGSLFQLMHPMLLGMAAGSMIGHLSRRSLGQYDLPVPRPSGDEILVVVPTIEEFAAEWSLPVDDVRLWVCLNEVATHAVLGVPHVRSRLEELIGGFVAGFRPDPGLLEQRLAELETSGADPMAEIQKLFADPAVLLGAGRSPAQEPLAPQLDALVCVIVGYVDHVVDRAAERLVSSASMVGEAFRRRRVETSEVDRFAERLFGLHLTQDRYDRGGAFIAGVLERDGQAAIDRLWSDPRALPTPAEVDAPGLWLARLEIDEPPTG